MNFNMKGLPALNGRPLNGRSSSTSTYRGGKNFLREKFYWEKFFRGKIMDPSLKSGGKIIYPSLKMRGKIIDPRAGK